MRTLTLLACLLLAGCGSSVEAISNGAQEVQAAATEIRTSAGSLIDLSAQAHSQFQDIHNLVTGPTAPDMAVLDRKAVDGMALMERITLLTRGIDTTAKKAHDSAATVLTNVTGVADITPWWATLLKQYGTLALIGVIVAAGFYFGIWPILARFIAVTFGWTKVLPKATVTAAKFDSEALEMPTADPVQREGVAARRAVDPDYDAAIKAMKKKGDAK